jgi:cobalt-zinc-cadmium efflux system membrane fusion protein
MHGQPFLLARASFDNSAKNWPPDLLVEGRVIVEKVPASVVVENRALQPYREGFAVFVKVGDTYEARPLQLGARDDRVTEVLGGLKAGDRYVTANSFLIKADIEKSGVSHDH